MNFLFFLVLAAAIEASKIKLKPKPKSPVRRAIPSSSSSSSSNSSVAIEAGDDLPLIRSIRGFATSNTLPTDLFLNGTEPKRLFTNKLYSKLFEGDRAMIYILKMEQEATAQDAAKALECTLYRDLFQWDELSFLPRIYIQKRAFLPFCTFLRRFRYPKEFEDPLKSSPVALIVVFILTQPQIEDLLPYFRILLQTQPEAIQSGEVHHLDAILKADIKGLPFLETYLQFASHEHTSSRLAYLLLKPFYNAVSNPEMMEKIINNPYFNPNTRINRQTSDICTKINNAFRNPEEDYCLLSRLVCFPDLPAQIVELVMDCERVDINASTGTLFLKSMDPQVMPSIRFHNPPLLYLALLLHNYSVSLAVYNRTHWLECLKALLLWYWFAIWWHFQCKFHYFFNPKPQNFFQGPL